MKHVFYFTDSDESKMDSSVEQNTSMETEKVDHKRENTSYETSVDADTNHVKEQDSKEAEIPQHS